MSDPNKQNPFGGLEFSERQLIYKGLVSLVRSNTGVGFVNSDQGHPAYSIGRRGGESDYKQWGDSPEHNKLFKMMHTLSVALCEAEIDGSSENTDYIFCWADFCEMAYSAYDQAKKG